jgi:hypothetical protein
MDCAPLGATLNLHHQKRLSQRTKSRKESNDKIPLGTQTLNKHNYLAGGVFLGKIENFPKKDTTKMWEGREKISFFLSPPTPS